MKTQSHFKVIYVLLLLACPILAEDRDQNRLYPYIFKESTGDNKFVVFEKTIVPVREFAKDSNIEAVNALKALRWNVLYPNSDGTKIFLKGTYNKVDSSFRLDGWFIIAPFISREIVDETRLPHQYKIVKRMGFNVEDFLTLVSKPAQYVRAIE